MSSDSEYDENPSDQQSEGEENEENGDQEKPSTSNGTTANGTDGEKSVTWNDLVRNCVNKVFGLIFNWKHVNF